MDIGFDAFFNMTLLAIVGSLVVMLGTTVLIVGVIIWAIRRAAPPREDPAVAELKRRLASGEISPVEFEVRMRALEEDREAVGTGPAPASGSIPANKHAFTREVRLTPRPRHAPPEHYRMISTGELRKGVVIELDGELWQILDYHHIKMGRGSAQVRIKFRNVKKGSTVEKSFQAGERWPRAQIDRRPVQYLYRDGDDLHFMETESYEQFSLRAETLDDVVGFLKEGMTLDRTSYQGETLGVELPVTVDLMVTETDPGFAGDTAQGARKNATLETGLVVTVPLFVNEGDTLRIDTRTGEYQTRL